MTLIQDELVEKTDDTLELIEGPITDFHWDRTTVNLLEQIQKNSKAKNAAVGAVAAAAGMYGAVASSAMLVMYDGEDVENFVCRIGDKIVCGQFSGADHLKNGDQVKAVVTKEKDVYLAQAVLRHADEVLWLPVGSYLGSNADLRDKIRSGWKAGVFVSIFYLVVCYFLSAPIDMILLVLVIPIFPLPIALWVHHDMRPITLRAERIFTALKFPYTEDLNMENAMYFIFKPATDDSLGSRTLSMFYYQKAIEFEKQRRLKKKLPL